MIIGAEADAPPTSRLGLHLSPIRARLGSDQVTPPGMVAMGHGDFVRAHNGDLTAAETVILY